MSPALEKARAFLAVAADCGLSLPGSSKNSTQSGSSSKTSLLEQNDGSIKSQHTWDSSAMKRYRSQSARRISELHTFDGASSLLPTPTASNYGSNRGGAAGRTGKVRHSLQSMARMGLLPTPTANQLTPSMAKHPGCRNLQKMAGGSGGRLSPQFVEAMMMFPIGHTDLNA